MWKAQELYDDTWGEVILMCGLPGTGKDHWIRSHCPSLPTVWLLHKGLPQGRDLSARWYDIRTANDVARAWCAHCYALNAAAARRLADILTPMANVADAWSTFARCGVRVLAASRPCAATREEASFIERKASLWRFRWVRAFYWFRYRLAFRLDLLMKSFAGKRRVSQSAATSAAAPAAASH